MSAEAGPLLAVACMADEESRAHTSSSDLHQQCCGLGTSATLTASRIFTHPKQDIRVDYDKTKEDQGHEGGDEEDAFEFIIKNKGVASEAAYPYTEANGKCKKEKRPL
ncbi:OLC1v1036874C1 [Oldenlandia corymbosa var. corymbosa]|uniref:OLC1v1036874C1 n=1 Tax=Oldenlandia corymbosa var. corymbosa TaxID=529605 RepID=A0AAV1CWF7_OLDCO|nr:OLC1v1036874C1 [Oldenlandia corymbosa var. corymbosa]